MSQAQCAMIIFFENNVIVFAEKLRNRRNKKKIERKARNYRTLSTLNIVIQHCDSMS